MSQIWLPDTPAYTQLRPEEPEWVDAGRNEKEFLTGCLGDLGRIESVQNGNDFPYGRYRAFDHNPPLFIKVLPASRFALQQQSQEVAAWINSRMLRCLKQIPQYCTIVEDRYLILVYEYFQGRFANFSANDMANLGKSVRHLHHHLLECPWVSQVERSGKHRQQTLRKTLRGLKKGFCSNTIPEYVCELLYTIEESAIHVLEEGVQQVIHGDLNYGNVMFSVQDGAPLIYDFEDTMTAWFAPEVENAFVIERFVLGPSDEQSVELAAAYCSEYKRYEGYLFKYPEQLEKILRALSVRALLILALKESKYPQSVQESEWQKFMMLYTQAEERSHLLREISNL